MHCQLIHLGQNPTRVVGKNSDDSTRMQNNKKSNKQS